ncbi:hypothetical protein [Pseudomonas umsongensis]|jgi:hypothetical protein|uniref:Uncharacterized protein n=1 Tax=Pseudomonas umsongensis TaxID=198618 RepID=A0AAE6ZWM1_9PSED|nr:hypothetical protein [Pseudomonas umsongensis]QJC79624.1 hypothetical protein HGP31_15345 [Pseudomonas umsongensis]
MDTQTKISIDHIVEQIYKQRNAEILEHKKMFAQKYPGKIDPAALVETTVEYQIKSYRFDYWAAFYIRLECYLTYETGEVMQFHGDGGGVGAGGGVYAGGNSTTFFSLPPKDLIGECSWYLQPVAIGALIHFWRGSTSIGTLVGAGAGTGLSFGGTGTWSMGS